MHVFISIHIFLYINIFIHLLANEILSRLNRIKLKTETRNIFITANKCIAGKKFKVLIILLFIYFAGVLILYFWPTNLVHTIFEDKFSSLAVNNMRTNANIIKELQLLEPRYKLTP